MYVWEKRRGSFLTYFDLTVVTKIPSNFVTLMPCTDSFKYTAFNRFPAYFDQLPLDLCDQLLFSIAGFLMNTKAFLNILAGIKKLICSCIFFFFFFFFFLGIPSLLEKNAHHSLYFSLFLCLMSL